MKTHDENGKRDSLALILVFVVLAVGCVSVGALYYRQYERQYRAEVERQLSAVGELKVHQIVRWRKERWGDAAVFYENAAFSALAQRQFSEPPDALVQGQLQLWLRQAQEQLRYDRVFLLGARGEERLSIPAAPEAADPGLAQRVADVVQSGQVTFVDFYRNAYDQRIYVAVLTPVFADATSRQVIGILLLRETLAALATDAGAVFHYDPGSDELRAVAVRGWPSQVDQSPLKPGEGVTGTLFASGEARYSPQLARDPLAHSPIASQIPDGWGGAFVPIRAATEIVGVLVVSLPLPRQITEQEMRLLDSLAEMAGITLHRMRLHEETVRRLEYLRALHEMDVAISTSFDLSVNLSILLRHVIGQMGVDAADVLLLHPQRQTLEYAAGQGFRTPAILGARIRLGDSPAGRVALERCPVQLFDSAKVEQTPALAALWMNERFVSYCGIPLTAKGEVKGVLEVFRRSPVNTGSEWLSSLEMLAGQAAITIDNAQLLENLQRANLDLSLACDAAIEAWSRALELRDKETEGRTERVARMTLQLAGPMGISDAETVHIQAARCCMISARWACLMPSCSSRASSPPRNGSSCASIRNWPTRCSHPLPVCAPLWIFPTAAMRNGMARVTRVA